MGFPGGSAGKESACNPGDLGSISGLGRSSGEENSYPLQQSGLENLLGLQRVRHNWATFTSLSFYIWGNWCSIEKVSCSYPTCMEKTIQFLWAFPLAQYLAAPLSFIIPDNNGPFSSSNNSFQLWEVITSCNPRGILMEKHGIRMLYFGLHCVLFYLIMTGY